MPIIRSWRLYVCYYRLWCAMSWLLVVGGQVQDCWLCVRNEGCCASNIPDSGRIANCPAPFSTHWALNPCIYKKAHYQATDQQFCVSAKFSLAVSGCQSRTWYHTPAKLIDSPHSCFHYLEANKALEGFDHGLPPPCKSLAIHQSSYHHH